MERIRRASLKKRGLAVSLLLILLGFLVSFSVFLYALLAENRFSAVDFSFSLISLLMTITMYIAYRTTK